MQFVSYAGDEITCKMMQTRVDQCRLVFVLARVCSMNINSPALISLGDTDIRVDMALDVTLFVFLFFPSPF